MSESEHVEWMHGLLSNGGYYQEKNCWLGDDKDLTMWDVVAELLLAGREKVGSSASSGLHMFNSSCVSGHLLEQPWEDVAATLTEANLVVINKIIEIDPPKWLPDSAASACILCGLRFHPILCSRHHCRFCGGVFYGDCTKGRSLLPARFHLPDPQRVCDSVMYAGCA